jgi:hypothetical protein
LIPPDARSKAARATSCKNGKIGPSYAPGFRRNDLQEDWQADRSVPGAGPIVRFSQVTSDTIFKNCLHSLGSTISGRAKPTANFLTDLFVVETMRPLENTPNQRTIDGLVRLAAEDFLD